MTNQPYDPWGAASNPPEDTKAFYGEVSINAYACMLVPGAGKVPFDAGVLDGEGKPYRRYTAVELIVAPLSESKLAFSLSRTMLAEFGEWKDTTWPSVKAMGVLNAQELAGKFVRVEQVPTGRKYTTRNGDEREATAVKFTDIYPDRATCLAAYVAEFGQPSNGNGGNGAPAAQYTTQAPAAADAPANGNGSQKETALKFAQAFVKTAMNSAKGDLDQARAILGPMLAKQALVSQYFTVDSPEIVELMAAAMTA
jgi:hypothetical protein